MKAVLHIVNKPNSGDLNTAGWLKYKAQGDGLIFIEDGIYNCIENTQTAPLFDNVTENVFVLSPDLLARGFKQKAVFEFIQPVDYSGFVDLTVKYALTQSWS